MSAASGPSKADLDRKSFSLNLLAPSCLRRLSFLRKQGDDEAKGAPSKACPAHIAQTISCNVCCIVTDNVSSKCTRASVTHTLDGTHMIAWHKAKLSASRKPDSHLPACKLPPDYRECCKLATGGKNSLAIAVQSQHSLVLCSTMVWTSTALAATSTQHTAHPACPPLRSPQAQGCGVGMM